MLCPMRVVLLPRGWDNSCLFLYIVIGDNAKMDVFEKLGLDVKPLINAAGTVTMYCGASMPQEVVDAMSQVANSMPVRMDELQAAASKVIAKITGAEAGYVTCGCSAALTAATAACLTGYDADRINRLPDTSGMPNEVLVAYNQRNGYDHAIRAAGAKIINVGMASHPLSPGEFYRTLPEDYEVNITDRTVAIAYFYSGGGIPPLEEVVRVSKKHNIPVILDAAVQVPPVENLRKFISMGVDLVAISGGKGIRGPQASGLLFGRHDLIGAAALNYFTPGFAAGYVSFENWSPPPSLVDKEKLQGRLPHHPLGRGLKVSKEAAIGLLVALQMFADEERNAKEMGRLALLLKPIMNWLEGIPGVQLERGERPLGGFPIITVKIDKLQLGLSAGEVLQRLRDSEPPIYVYAPRVSEGEFIINSCSLNEKQADIVANRLHAVLTSK